MSCFHGARYSGVSDEQLMSQFYACDDVAFDELWWCRWSKEIRRFIAADRKINRSDIDDILDEVALKLCETKHRPSVRFDPQKGKLKNWLYRIARNEMINWLRHQGKETPFTKLEDLAEEGGEGETPDVNELLDRLGLTVSGEEGFERMEIREAVEKLQEPSRTIIMLHFWDDMTQQEIAERLGISTPTVNRRLNHDLECLRNFLEGRGVGKGEGGKNQKGGELT